MIYFIDNKKYDLTEFIKNHPGGNDIKLFSSTNEPFDIAIHYQMIHGKQFNHEKYKKFLIEDSNVTPYQPTEFGKEIQNIIKGKNYNAGWEYFYKCIFIFTMVIIFDILVLVSPNTPYKYIYSCFLGFFISMYASNIVHDVSHGTLGKMAQYNTYHFRILYRK